MPATTKHFVCWQGETFRRTLVLIDAAGAAVDLTGCSGVLQVVPSIGGDPIFELSSGDGLTFGDEDGTIDIEISAADTLSADTTGLESQTVTDHIKSDGVEMYGTGPTAIWSLEITWSDDSVSREVEGNFCFVPRVIG